VLSELKAQIEAAASRSSPHMVVLSLPPIETKAALASAFRFLAKASTVLQLSPAAQ
jgi:hypothetical protein